MTVTSKHPRPGDPAVVYGESATVVAVRAVGSGAPPTGDWPAIVSISGEAGLLWEVVSDRLLWDGQRWNVLPVDPPMPLFMHEDPEYADPVTAAKAEADRVA